MAVPVRVPRLRSVRLRLARLRLRRVRLRPLLHLLGTLPLGLLGGDVPAVLTTRQGAALPGRMLFASFAPCECETAACGLFA